MKTDNSWCHIRKKDIMENAREECPFYIFDEETLNEIFFDLLSIDAVERLFFPVQAGFHSRIIQKAFEMDLGFKCGNIVELDGLRKKYRGLAPDRIFYAPDTLSERDLKGASHYVANILVNEQYLYECEPEVLQKYGIFLEMDLSKGIKKHSSIDPCIKGLYLYPKDGLFPLFDSEKAITFIGEALGRFPEVRILILGNGPTKNRKDEDIHTSVEDLARSIEYFKETLPNVDYWLEVPLYMIYRACGLVVRVLDVYEASGLRYISVNLGMGISQESILQELHYEMLNLSRDDIIEKPINTRIVGRGKTPVNGLDITRSSAHIIGGDILFLKHVLPDRSSGTGSDKRVKDPIPVKCVSARSICQVKI